VTHQGELGARGKRACFYGNPVYTLKKTSAPLVEKASLEKKPETGACDNWKKKCGGDQAHPSLPCDCGRGLVRNGVSQGRCLTRIDLEGEKLE